MANTDKSKELRLRCSLINGHTVFIDTTLDTHLLIIISNDDTVTDVKRKIEKEHNLYFSEIGDIHVHALKVKRRGHFYFLSDSMLVRDAFAYGMAKKNWFLSVDASVKKHEERQDDTHNLGTTNTPVNMPRDETLIDSHREREVSLEHVEPENSKSRRDVVGEASQPDQALIGDNIYSTPPKLTMTLQPLIQDTERSENGNYDGMNGKDKNDSDPHKSKKTKKSKRKADQELGDAPAKTKSKCKADHQVPNEGVVGDDFVAGSGVRNQDLDGLDVISNGGNSPRTHKVSTNVEEQEPLAYDSQHRVDNSEKKMEDLVKDYLPVDDAERNKSHMDVEISVNNDNVSQQPEKVAEEHGLFPNNLDSSLQEENWVKKNDVDGTANLVGENESAVPTDTGKKRKRAKKTKDSVQVSEVNFPTDPLGVKSGNEKAMDEVTNLLQKDANEVAKENAESAAVAKKTAVNEVKIDENIDVASKMEEEPVKKKSRKKQKSSTKNPGEDIIQRNPTPEKITKSDFVASFKTTKIGKSAKDQNDSAFIEHESVPAESTIAQSQSIDHGDMKTRDEPDLSGKNTSPTETENQISVSETGIKNRLDKPLPEVGTSDEIPVLVKQNKAAKTPRAKKSAKIPKVQSESLDHGDKKTRDEPDLSGKNTGTIEIENLMNVSETGNKNRPDKPLPDVDTSDEVPVLVEKKGLQNKAAKTPRAKKSAKISEAQSQSFDHADKKTRDEPNLSGKITSPTETGNKNRIDKPLPDVDTSNEVPVLMEKKGPQNKAAKTPRAKKSAKIAEAQSESLDHKDEKTRDEPDLSGTITNPTETGNKNRLDKPLPDVDTSNEVPVLVEEKGPQNKAAKTPRAKKSTKTPETHSVNVKSSSKSSQKQANPAENLVTVDAQEPPSTEKSNESIKPPEKKSPKVAVSNSTVTAASKSLMERPRNKTTQSHLGMTEVKKPLNIKSSGAKKKLLSTPGAIFNNDSDSSSDDGEKMDGSDDSTRTPSDLSSDDSDGEDSNAKLKSLQKGSQTPENAKSVLGSCSTTEKKKNLTFGILIRNTSRFKNAKLAASQPDDESQQVDFVPDSQPIY